MLKKQKTQPLGLDQTKQEVELYIINVQAGTSVGLGWVGVGGAFTLARGFTALPSMTQTFQHPEVVQAAPGGRPGVSEQLLQSSEPH